MINRRKLFIAICIITLVIGLVIGFILLSSKSNEVKKSQSKPFTISGLEDPRYLLSSDKQSVIVSGIDNYLKADSIKTDNLMGIVRKDSFTQREVYGSNVITVLIDIPNAKRSYKISSSGSGSPDGDNSLYILCPAQDELIYGSFNCKDDTDG